MDQQEFKEELRKIILPILEEERIELVELSFARTKGGHTLKLLVDRIEGRINIQECAHLNKMIGGILDTQGIIKDWYSLEVSSPGLDRPLSTKDEFLRCTNRKVRVFFREAIDNKTEMEGVINKADDDAVFIDVDGEIKSIPLVKISKAKQVF